MIRIASLVTNDLHQDQRMNRICHALQSNGYEVTLIGRKRKSSGKLDSKSFGRTRLHCFFEKGILFYAEYNIRLFFHLMTHSYDVINANDLDTILPAIIVGRLRGKKVVYDAHEYFTEQEEVVNRPRVKAVWKWIERYSVPKVDGAYTVSKGYADLFEKEYPTKFGIVRNATVLDKNHPEPDHSVRYILYQGAVNYGRGLEQVIDAMQNVDCQLYICGAGDILNQLKEQTTKLGLTDKVKFWGFIEPAELKVFTRNATIGLTLFAKDGLSHWHSLANRFFDYMHAGVPQLAMEYPEYISFQKEHEIALLVKDIQPSTLSKALNELLTNHELYQRLHDEAVVARETANWQAQEKSLLKIYDGLDR